MFSIVIPVHRLVYLAQAVRSIVDQEPLLDMLRNRQAACPCVALGFGPGLVAEAALLR